MTKLNDEVENDEGPNGKSEANETDSTANASFGFRISSFGFPSSFVIRLRHFSYGTGTVFKIVLITSSLVVCSASAS